MWVPLFRRTTELTRNIFIYNFTCEISRAKNSGIVKDKTKSFNLTDDLSGATTCQNFWGFSRTLQNNLAQICFVFFSFHVDSLSLKKFFWSVIFFLWIAPALYGFHWIPAIPSSETYSFWLVFPVVFFSITVVALFASFLNTMHRYSLFQKLNLRKTFFQATYHFFQTSLFYCVWVEVLY